MAFDEQLAERVRAVLGTGASEREMFGGIAFMVAGHMACGVLGDELMVRLGADGADAALDEPHTRVMDMTGRPMKNFVVVAPSGVPDDAALASWVGRGEAFARSLPPK